MTRLSAGGSLLYPAPHSSFKWVGNSPLPRNMLLMLLLVE
jgi:hypothetical protein